MKQRVLSHRFQRDLYIPWFRIIVEQVLSFWRYLLSFKALEIQVGSVRDGTSATVLRRPWSILVSLNGPYQFVQLAGPAFSLDLLRSHSKFALEFSSPVTHVQLIPAQSVPVLFNRSH